MTGISISRFISCLCFITAATNVVTVVDAISHIKLVDFADGFTSPNGIVSAFDGTGRLFVVENGGLIHIVSSKTGDVTTTPFLDMSNDIDVCGEPWCLERGLLGLAFHPDFEQNGYFYINYTSGTDAALKTIISRFYVDPSYPDVAVKSSEKKLLKYDQPYGNHNGGDLKFGPNDGYLYIASGDGGAAGDPEGRGQNLQSMLGKILRIDVDDKGDDGKKYKIPGNNPFANTAGALPEIWAYGLRNPWRISFDMDKEDLWLPDVGQGSWEEVNFQPKSSVGGENYGWNVTEGDHCFADEDNTCDTTAYIAPILEYVNEGFGQGDCSIIGGYMVRRQNGKEKGLNGLYIYGDWCTAKIWALKKKNGKWKNRVLYDKFDKDSFEYTETTLNSFGQGEDGKLYVVYINGTIKRIKNCSDSKKYYFQKKKRTCKFISKKQGRIDKYCVEEEVQGKCKQTCGTC